MLPSQKERVINMTTDKACILLIEDDAKIARFIELELICEGYEVIVCKDGIEGLTQVRERKPDLVILDRMLPGMEGIEVCQRLRRTSNIPILMLTARAAFPERVEGLDAGANDYLVKPFNLDELLARIRVQLRQKSADSLPRLEFEDLLIDLQTRVVMRAEQSISLAPKEFELLVYFMQHPQHVLTRQRIVERLWDWVEDDNVLDVYIHSLREKLEAGGKSRILHTVRGVGYSLRSHT